MLLLGPPVQAENLVIEVNVPVDAMSRSHPFQVIEYRRCIGDRLVWKSL